MQPRTAALPAGSQALRSMHAETCRQRHACDRSGRTCFHRKFSRWSRSH